MIIKVSNSINPDDLKKREDSVTQFISIQSYWEATAVDAVRNLLQNTFHDSITGFYPEPRDREIIERNYRRDFPFSVQRVLDKSTLEFQLSPEGDIEAWLTTPEIECIAGEFLIQDDDFKEDIWERAKLYPINNYFVY